MEIDELIAKIAELKLEIEGLKEKNQDLQDKIFYLEVINKEDYEGLGLDIIPYGHRCRGLK